MTKSTNGHNTVPLFSVLHKAKDGKSKKQEVDWMLAMSFFKTSDTRWQALIPIFPEDIRCYVPLYKVSEAEHNTNTELILST